MKFSAKHFKYITIGGITFLAYTFGLYIAYTIFGLPYPIAVALSYVCATAIHFFANRSFTFSAQKMSPKNQLIPYLSVAFLNYLIQIFTIYLLFVKCSFNFYVSTFISILVTILIGYTLLDKWVFKN